MQGEAPSHAIIHVLTLALLLLSGSIVSGLNPTDFNSANPFVLFVIQVWDGPRAGVHGENDFATEQEPPSLTRPFVTLGDHHRNAMLPSTPCDWEVEAASCHL